MNGDGEINPQPTARDSLQGDARRSRRASAGLCQCDVAILSVIRRAGPAGIRQSKIILELATAFSADQPGDKAVIGSIRTNRNKIYASCLKLLYGVIPGLVRQKKVEGHHPKLFITSDGERILDAIVKVHPQADQVRWLMSEYYAAVGGGKKPRLVTWEWLTAHDLQLVKSV